MRDELISKQKILNTLKEWLGEDLPATLYGDGYEDAVSDIIRLIETEVPVRAVKPCAQQKTGRWKHVEIESNKSDTGYFMLPLCECSVCEIYVEQESNYCPNCGADMRSKAREYLEYGELITKGIAQGLRGDSDE